MDTYSEYHHLYHQYMAYDDPRCEGAAMLRQRLTPYPAFQFTMTKWNGFPLQDLDVLVRVTVAAVWRPGHDLIHRLQEIGHTHLLTGVFYLYLRWSLIREIPPTQILRSKSLHWWVRYYLSNFRQNSSDPVACFDHVLPRMRWRLRQLAADSGDYQLQEVVVVLAVLMKEWGVVMRVLQRVVLPLPFYTSLYVWLRAVPDLCETIQNRVNQNMNSMSALEQLREVAPSAEMGEGLAEEREGRHLLWEVLDQASRQQWQNELRDRALYCAALGYYWTYVKLLLGGCSEVSVLLQTFELAVISGVADVAGSILQYLAQDVHYPAVLSVFMFHILQGAEEEEQVARHLLLECALLGMSTHYLPEVSDPQLAVLASSPSSVTRLALRAGLVSYSQCFESIARSGAATVESREFLEELQAEGIRPLVDVCRLAISHRIGYHPLRQQRIESLPLPPICRWMVSFCDVYCANVPV